MCRKPQSSQVCSHEFNGFGVVMQVQQRVHFPQGGGLGLADFRSSEEKVCPEG